MNKKYIIVGLIILGVAFSMFAHNLVNTQAIKESGWNEITVQVIKEIFDIEKKQTDASYFNIITPYVLLMVGVLSIIIGIRVDW